MVLNHGHPKISPLGRKRITRFDSGEHSCVGVVSSYNYILVPDWCITINGEKRGRIAIYSPKREVISLSRACSKCRYDQQFDLVYEDDDLRELIGGTRPDVIPNAVFLKIPKSLANLQTSCFWNKGNLFSIEQMVTPVLVSWRRGPNGEFFMVQKVIDESYKQMQSFEDLKTGNEDIAEAVISISAVYRGEYFEGFFHDPPQKLESAKNDQYGKNDQYAKSEQFENFT
ncbi:uncharacterized protein LOC141853972 [Brevipalpus obovatus]|uniref:uncharacterized protein LOC141853972 n=1 Tax=Brevipalpus obovatus TaxID=246614 RepID=UPI003D9F4A82